MGRMTPKDKAQELFNKIYPLCNPHNDNTFKDNMNQKIHVNEVGAILINEILNVLESGNLYIEQGDDSSPTNTQYWLDVKERWPQATEHPSLLNK